MALRVLGGGASVLSSGTRRFSALRNSSRTPMISIHAHPVPGFLEHIASMMDLTARVSAAREKVS